MDFDLSTILSGAAGIATGGVTGLLGVLFKKGFDWLGERQKRLARKDEMAHELAMRDKDKELMLAEADGRFKVAKEEGETARDVAATNAFSKGLAAEPERYATGPAPKNWVGTAAFALMTLMDFIRALIRPVLTISLCWASWKIYVRIDTLLERYGYNMPAEQVAHIWSQIIFTVLYLMTTCVLFWFYTRNPSPPPKIS